jgi:lipid-A-disaccharide synthase
MGLPTTFVGNPVVDRARPERQAARNAVGAGHRPVVALFPGSRRIETNRLTPLFLAAAARIRAARRDVLILTGNREGQVGEGECLASVAVAAADVALCKSGTITLEAALAGTPTVIAYRTNAATHWLAKRLVRVPYIGLPNLLLERTVVPELIQDQATPEALASAVLHLLDRPQAAAAQRDAFRALPELLGPPGVAARVAALAAEVAGA